MVEPSRDTGLSSATFEAKKDDNFDAETA
jgi:hypothetical protein